MNYSLEISGRPVPKGRPRVAQHSTYTPAKTIQKEDDILAKWLGEFGRVELEGELTLSCAFTYTDHKTADLDNLIKLVADALGGGGDGYKPFNDKQIKSIYGYIEQGEEPKTEITIAKREEQAEISVVDLGEIAKGEQ